MGRVQTAANRVGQKYPLQPRAIGIMTASFFTIMIAYSVRYGYGMLLPGMLESMRITKAEAGGISASYFVAYTICSPFLGMLSDRTSPRLLLSCFTLLLAIGTLLMAQVSTVLEGCLAFGLVGVGHAACWAPVVSLVQHWVDDRVRGTALAVVTMGSSIGIAAWSLWLPLVFERTGYTTGWLQMGVFGLFVAGLNLLLVRRAPAQATGTVAEKRTMSGKGSYGSLHLLASKELWIVGVSYACVGFTVLVPLTFLNVYATEELRLSYGVATRAFTVMAVAGIAGKLVLGALSDRLNRVAVMAMCGVLLGIGCCVIAYSQGLFGIYCAVSLVGLGFGAVWPVYAAAAVDLFPRSQAGSVIGLWTVFLGVGSICSPLLCGWCIDVTGSYALAFHIGGGGGFLSALLLLRPLHGTGRRSMEEAAD